MASSPPVSPTALPWPPPEVQELFHGSDDTVDAFDAETDDDIECGDEEDDPDALDAEEEYAVNMLTAQGLLDAMSDGTKAGTMAAADVVDPCAPYVPYLTHTVGKIEDLPKTSIVPSVFMKHVHGSGPGDAIFSPFMAHTSTGIADSSRDFYVALTRPDGNCCPNGIAIMLYIMEALSNQQVARTFNPDTKGDHILQRSNMLRCMVAARCNDGDCDLRAVPSADTTAAQLKSSPPFIKTMDLLAMAYATDDRSDAFDAMGDNAPAAYSTRIARSAQYWGETELAIVRDMIPFMVYIMTFQPKSSGVGTTLRAVVGTRRLITKRSPLLHFFNLIRTGPTHCGHFDVMLEPILLRQLKEALNAVGNGAAFTQFIRGLVPLETYHSMHSL